MLLALFKLVFEELELLALLVVLLENELVLLAVVRQNDHVGDDLLSQLAQLVVALLYFFVQRLVFDLQLFKIDQVQPVR